MPYLFEGYCRFFEEDNCRFFGFSLSISNPTDTDNAVAQLELQLIYTTLSGGNMAVKIRHDVGLTNKFECGDIVPLQIPARIDAHQTIAGWVFFRVDDSLLSDAAVDAYTIILTDSHGAVCTLESTIVRELVDEEKLAKKDA